MKARKLGNTGVEISAIELTERDLHRLEVIAPVGVAAGMRYPEGAMRVLNG